MSAFTPGKGQAMTLLERGVRWVKQQRALDRPGRLLAAAVASATRARVVKNALNGQPLLLTPDAGQRR